MDPVVASIGLSAIEAGVSAALAAIAKSTSGAATNKILRWRSSAVIRDLATTLDQVRRVKTLWQFEKAIDIIDIYYPTKLLMYRGRAVPGSERATISRLDDAPVEGNLLVQGTVGQGKSFLLRYLTIVEAVDGKKLPFFVELRRLREDETLLEYLHKELKIFGLDVDPDSFGELARSGKFLLLLDAFDEIGPSRRTALLLEIEQLARSYPKMRILMSSRPGTGVEYSWAFDVCNVAPLQGTEYEDVISRICDSPDIANRLVNGLAKGHYDIINLLTTPLMVGLLVFRYRVDQSIPENQVAFFSELFSLLLRRHDRSKAGYERPRKSELGDKALERVFFTMCYLTRREGRISFSAQTMYAMATEALTYENAHASADRVLDDISTITCLLLEEGGEYRFIHKIVQEYHAASFVSHQTDDAAREFYTAMRGRWDEWRQEIYFLEALDEFRFLKFFLLPMCEAVLLPAQPNPESRILRAMGLVCAHDAEAPSCWVTNYQVDTSAPEGWAIFRAGDVPAVPPFPIPSSTLTNRSTAAELVEMLVDPHAEGLRRFAEEVLTFVKQELAAAREKIALVDQRRALMQF